MPDAVTAVLHVLLYLPLLPSRGRVTELGVEQVVADHGAEAQIDVTQLALAHPIHGGLHVVVDAATRDTAPGHKGVVMGIEQHLVGLQQIRAQEEGAAVAQLELGHLQLGALAGDDRPVLAPVELEGLTLCEGQGAELTWARTPTPLKPLAVLDIFRQKTAPAFAVALLVGANYAGADDELCETLTAYSEAVGIAYQIRDDLDDFHADSDGDDLCAVRPNILLALGLEKAKGDAKAPLAALCQPLAESDRRDVAADRARELSLSLGVYVPPDSLPASSIRPACCCFSRPYCPRRPIPC